MSLIGLGQIDLSDHRLQQLDARVAMAAGALAQQVFPDGITSLQILFVVQGGGRLSIYLTRYDGKKLHSTVGSRATILQLLRLVYRSSQVEGGFGHKAINIQVAAPSFHEIAEARNELHEFLQGIRRTGTAWEKRLARRIKQALPADSAAAESLPKPPH